MSDTTQFWAREQMKLRNTFDTWVTEEIGRYEAQGFDALFGSKDGHALDEVGGYTRSFVSAYCVSGDQRIPVFMKRFRDDWHAAVTAAGYMYHGYDSNEHGDYITHTAEAFTQFLLNVLYLDAGDPVTVDMVEDAAEHLGNWNPEIQDWYDWDNHVFLSYYLGTRSPYHMPPYNFQTPRHFRVLAIAAAAYDVTRKKRYLDLCTDYCDRWAEHILAAESDQSLHLGIKLITDEQIAGFAKEERYSSDWRFTRYYSEELERLGSTRGGSAPIVPGKVAHHGPHDLIVTWLDIFRFVPKQSYREALRRVMSHWIGLGEDRPSQIAGLEPHCGVHLPKYRSITGDTGLDEMYLAFQPNGVCSYLLTGDKSRLEGSASAADGIFAQSVLRNRGFFGEQFATEHACNAISIAGSSSAFVAPSLFLPVFGGLNVHYGRAPWVQVLYYTDGHVGLPRNVSALFVPDLSDGSSGVEFVNLGETTETVYVRSVDPGSDHRIVLTDPTPADATAVSIPSGSTVSVSFNELVQQ